MPTIDIIVSQPITVIDVIAQRAGVAGPPGVAGAAGPEGPAGPSIGVIVSDTAPGSPIDGQLWFESDTGALLLFYDGTWIQLNLIPLPVEEDETVVTHDAVDITHDAAEVTHT